MELERIQDMEFSSRGFISDWSLSDDISPHNIALTEHLSKKCISLILRENYTLTYFSISPPQEYIKNAPKDLQIKTASILLNTNHLRENIKNKKNRIKFYNILFKENYFILASFDFSRKKGRRPQPSIKKLEPIFKSWGDYKFSLPYQKRIRSSLSLELRKKILTRDNYTCKYCGWQNGRDGMSDRILHIDHIVPVSFGGTNKKENLCVACLNCNISKNDKFLKELVGDWIWERTAS